MNSRVAFCTPCYEPILSLQAPFNSEFIGPQRRRLFLVFRNWKADACRKMPGMPQKSVPGQHMLHIFPEKAHHPMRNKKLAKVPDFGGPNLDIEWAALHCQGRGLLKPPTPHPAKNRPAPRECVFHVSPVASPGIFEWGWVGVMTSTPTYLHSILCFSSFLGRLILVIHRLHNFWYFSKTKITKKWYLWGGLDLGLMASHDERE